MEPLGGTISRSNVDDEYDEFLDDQVKAIQSDIAADRASLRSANEKQKLKIQQKIAQLKEKRHQRIAELKEKRNAQKGVRLKEKINEHKSAIAELETKLHKIEG